MNDDKFPVLKLLRAKEQQLIKQLKLDNSNLMKKPSSSSPKNDDDNKAASSLNIKKNKGKNASSKFVQTPPLEQELSDLREEIESVESEISRHLYSALIKYSFSINYGLDIVAKLDNIFARASFGIIPFYYPPPKNNNSNHSPPVVPPMMMQRRRRKQKITAIQ